MTLLRLDGLTVLRSTCPVVDSVSFSLAAGECVGLIGPNGAGKTTLLRAALGLLPHRGRSSLTDLPAAARARHAAWLPQEREIAWPVTVETLVMLGRLPHRAAGMSPTPQDRVAVAMALARMDLTWAAQRPATALSGGEQARVLLARALAQNSPLLLADEPVAGLDPAHAIAAMEAFASLAATGHAVLVSIHDLALAARHCTRLLLLDQGRLVADGPPRQVLTPANLRAVFRIEGEMVEGRTGPGLRITGRAYG